MHRDVDVGQGGSSNVAFAVVAVCLYERLCLCFVLCRLSGVAMIIIVGNSVIADILSRVGNIVAKNAPFRNRVCRLTKKQNFIKKQRLFGKDFCIDV